MTGPAGHPTWCAPGHCDADRGGQHRSPTSTIPSTVPGQPTVGIYLWAAGDQPTVDAQHHPAIALQLAVATGTGRVTDLATYDVDQRTLLALARVARQTADQVAALHGSRP